MSNKELSRRRLLKKLAAGSGALGAVSALPEKWRKPVVDSVILPAHAATTTAPASCNGKIAGSWSVSAHSANGVVNFTTTYVLSNNGTYTESGIAAGTWSLSGNTVTLTSSGGDTLTGAITPPNCNAMSGNGTVDNESVTWSGAKL